MNASLDFHYRMDAIHPAWFSPMPAAVVTRLSRSNLGRQRLFAKLFSGSDSAEQAKLLLDGKQPLRDREGGPFAALFSAGAKELFEIGAWCYAGLLQTVVEGRQVRRLYQIFGEDAYRSAIARRDIAASGHPDLQRQFQCFLLGRNVNESRRQVYRRGVQEAFSLLLVNGQKRAAAWYRLRFRPGRISADAPVHLKPGALSVFCRHLEERS